MDKKEKIEVPHVTLLQYVEGIERSRVDWVLRYGDFKPVDHFDTGDIFEQSFGFVKDAQETLNYSGLSYESFIKLLKERLGRKEEEVYAMSVYKIHEAKLKLKQDIVLVNKVESEQLGKGATDEERRAGIDRFDKYKTFPQFDMLAGGDPLKYKSLEALPYSVLFTKMMLEADRSDFNKALFKIRNPKH